MTPDFDAAFRQHFLDLLVWRRDVRRFRTDPLPAGTMKGLLEVACLAPSVGLSQPWRFVGVADPARRQAVCDLYARCNADALAAQPGERAALYARLKLAGLADAPEHLAVFIDPDPGQGGGLGRHTMPETLAYSAVTAIHTLWLAARTQGIGVGWVSILDPVSVREALDLPSDWSFIAYLCLGWPQEEHEDPELERHGWEQRQCEASVKPLVR